LCQKNILNVLNKNGEAIIFFYFGLKLKTSINVQKFSASGLLRAIEK
jgi:hypothetical protein